eukprot:9009227-Pyramimonas_sp.AAC.1
MDQSYAGRAGIFSRCTNQTQEVRSFSARCRSCSTDNIDTKRGNIDTKRGNIDTKRGNIDTKRGNIDTKR